MKSLPLAALLLAALSLAAAAPEPTKVTLDMRKQGGPYKTSAYSFRQATADPTVHRNYVDLLLNNCGSLHIKATTGQKNRICDLGQVALKDAPNAAPANATWFVEAVKPQKDHTYLEEIDDGDGRTMAVKFHVDDVKADSVEFSWLPTQPLQGPPPNPNQGASGTKGKCGGPHAADH
jgi:hypothetical protein